MLEDACNLSHGVAGLSHVDRQWGCVPGSLGGRIKPIPELAHLLHTGTTERRIDRAKFFFGYKESTHTEQR